MSMDITIIITIVFSTLAFVISIISLVYTSQQAKSSKEQARLLKEDSENKKTLANASKAIIQAIDEIKKTAKVGILSPLDLSRDDVLTYLHDNPKEVDISLTITPVKIQVIADGKFVTVKQSQDLIDILMESVKTSAVGGNFNFYLFPHIFKNEHIELGDLLYEIRAYYIAYDFLKEHEEVIRSCDNAIIDDFKVILDQIIEMLMLSMSKEHILKFDSKDRSTDILKKLNEGIIDMKLIRMLEDLLRKMCDDRLVPVQKKLFEMALQ
jgi:hypothetical protein